MNGKILKQVQKMQKEMARIQEELADEKVESTSGGGMVKAVVNGKQEILEIKIDPTAVNPDDIELLEDMVLAAVREAMTQSQELAQNKMGRLTGGLNIPGLF